MKRIPFRLEDTQEYQEFLRQQQAISPAAEDALLPAPDERQAVVNPQGVYEPMDPMRFYSGAMGDTALLNQPMYQASQAAGRGMSAVGNMASQFVLEPAVDLGSPMQASMQERLPQTSMMPEVSDETMGAMTPFERGSYQAMDWLGNPANVAPAAMAMAEPTPFELMMAGTGAGLPLAAMSGGLRKIVGGAKRFTQALSSVKAIDPRAADRLRNATMGRKYVQSMLPYLNEDEMLRLASNSDTNAANAIDAFEQFLDFAPQARVLQAAAKVGRSKQGWYENSRNAIEHVFGDDADLFAGFLAATSPQTSVESNLQNALTFYRNWKAAGRPTDPAAIDAVLARSVQGAKGEESVLDAWRKNVQLVAQNANTLSGPKVDSFWANLRSRPRLMESTMTSPDDAVTLDAWMAALFGMDKTTFSGGGAKLASGDPGLSSRYLAGTALVRKAAADLGITPAEMQETTWSFAKALYEKAESLNMTPAEVLKKKLLSDDDISGTVDFALLLKQPQYKQLLDADTVKRVEKIPEGRKPTMAMLDPTDQKAAEQAANILGRILTDRQNVSAMKAGRVMDPRGVVTQATMEVTPAGREPWRLTPSQETKLMSASEDLAGRNILQEALTGRAVPVQRGIGDYQDQVTGAVTNSPVASSGVAARLRGGRVAPQDVAAQDIVNVMSATVHGQEAMGTTALRFAGKGPKNAMRFTTPAQLQPQQIQQLKTSLNNPNWIVNTRADGLDLVWIGDEPMNLSADMQKELESAVQAATDQASIASAIDRGKPAPTKFQKVRGVAGTNVAATTPSTLNPSATLGYLSMPARNTQTRAQTQMLAQALSNVPRAQVARLDAPAVRTWARKTADLYSKVENYPPELQNYLRLIAEGGVSNLMNAMKDPTQMLPVLAALGVTPTLLNAWLADDNE